MIGKAPVLTNSGQNLFIRAIGGEQVTFTRFKIGNGTLPSGSDGHNLDNLINPIVAFGISEVDDTNEGYLTVNGHFDSTDVPSDFKLRELGLFCKGEDNIEHLYCYCNDGNNAGTIKANESDVSSEHDITLVIAIGEAEHVTAIISEGTLYASKEAFEDHIQDTNNPHQVTKEQVGLGNVPNVATNNQTVTFTQPAELTPILSGDKVSTAFGRIAKAIMSLISHLGNTDNPHGITPSQIGAASYSHTHTTADIMDGILGIGRGGTGESTLAGFAKRIGQDIENVLFDTTKTDVYTNRAKTVTTDIDRLTDPGIYYVPLAVRNQGIPFTVEEGEYVDALVFVFHAYPAGTTLLGPVPHQLAMSISPDRPSQILRRGKQYPLTNIHSWTSWI